MLSPFLLGVVAMLPLDEPRPVVVTTDCGASIDDQWALVHMAVSPRIDLKGIVTNHAPTLDAPAAETSARSVREVLSSLPERIRPPVIVGSSGPLERRDSVHHNAGVTFLLEQSKGHSSANRLVVVVIGAATDVASALRIDPSWADRVEILAMAFNAWPDGGDPWNVKNDVRAWQILLESHVPITVGDDAVSRNALTLSTAAARKRLGQRGKAGSRLTNAFDRWLEANPEMARHLTGAVDRWPIWDEVVTADLLDLTSSETRPRPVLRDDRTFDHDRGQGQIRWITSIDAAHLWDDLSRSLDKVEALETP